MNSTKVNEEIQKLKAMSFKDKCWYIWEYYKVHILLVLGVIFLLATLLPSIINKKYPVFTCYIINNPLYDEEYTTLMEDFSAYANLGDTKDVWELDATIVLDLENSMNTGYEYLMKISAVIASKGLDVMIGDVTTIDHYSSLAGFLDLKEILPGEILDLTDGRLHYVADDSGKEKAYAIDISDSAVLKNVSGNQDALYFSIPSNSPHLDMSILFLKYLLNL